MPLTPIDYQKATIYKIQSIDNEELLYVGSTTNFIKRKQCHKKLCNNLNNRHNDLKVYKMIRENGGWDQFSMIIVKEFPCNNKTELLIEEDRIMREMRSNMNKYKAFRTSEECKEYQKEYHKEYYELNKEKLNEKRKKKIVCECGSEISFSTKSIHLRSIKHQNFLLLKL